MEGMFFPVMYLYPDLSSIDETNKTISKVYKINIDLGEADLIAAARERWIEETEPSVSVKEIKTASRTFKTGTRFAESNRSWLDIKTYADVYDGGAPKCLAGFKLTSGYDSFDMEDVFGRPIMTAYYLAMEQAKYLVQGEYQCYLPLCILRDQNKKIVSKGFITAAENMAYQLIRDIKTVDKALNSSDPANDNNKHEIQTVERVLGNRFMRYCEGLFKKEFIPEIAKIDEDDDFYTETLKEKLNNYISKMAGYSWQLIYQVPVPYGKSIEAQKIYEKIRTERKKRREQHSNKSN